MSEFDVDVLICTRKKQTDNLVCQVQTVLNSGVNARVTIGIEGEYPELYQNFTEAQLKRVRVVSNVPQGTPGICIKYCTENLEWSDWLLSTADDDALLPWGLKHLWENTKGVSMVVGQVIGVSRSRHLDFSAWKIGIGVIPCHINLAMINMRSLEKLPKPWFLDDPMADYHQAKMMADNFPYKVIPNVVGVSAFAEMENLDNSFYENFMRIYGHLDV